MNEFFIVISTIGTAIIGLLFGMITLYTKKAKKESKTSIKNNKDHKIFLAKESYEDFSVDLKEKTSTIKKYDIEIPLIEELAPYYLTFNENKEKIITININKLSTDNNKNLYYLIKKTTTTFGRSSDCDLTIDDKAVSRNQFNIIINDGKVYIEDLSSSNGTFVNNIRILSITELFNGDQIKVGQSSFTFGKFQDAWDSDIDI